MKAINNITPSGMNLSSLPDRKAIDPEYHFIGKKKSVHHEKKLH